MQITIKQQGFNTSTVSVESNEWTKSTDYKVKFQYFNCIGGILRARSRDLARNKFQYFNCIGGIVWNLGLWRF